MATNEKNEILNPRQNNKTNRQKREEEQKQIRMLKIFGAAALGIVVLAVIIGIIVGIVNKPSRKTVAKVGNETIKLDEFQKAVSLQRSNINNNYAYMQQLYAMFGMQVDESTREQYAMQMSDAYKGILGQQVLSNMIDQRVMALAHRLPVRLLSLLRLRLQFLKNSWRSFAIRIHRYLQQNRPKRPWKQLLMMHLKPLKKLFPKQKKPLKKP